MMLACGPSKFFIVSFWPGKVRNLFFPKQSPLVGLVALVATGSAFGLLLQWRVLMVKLGRG